jgi:hypothetical protein
VQGDPALTWHCRSAVSPVDLDERSLAAFGLRMAPMPDNATRLVAPDPKQFSKDFGSTLICFVQRQWSAFSPAVQLRKRAS